MNLKRAAWFGDVYERGQPGLGQAGLGRFALTFDDGPIDGATPQILDSLKALRATATFFVIGRYVDERPDLVRRMHAEGHLIGNHTYDHSRLSMLRGPWYWREQIEKTDAALTRIIGRRPLMFRPPMGIRTPINCGAVRRSGHACVMWSRRAMDGVATTTDRILQRLLNGATDGDVLLLHDGREPASKRDPTPTVRAVERLVNTMRERGLSPVPLDELLGIPAYADSASYPSPLGRG